MATGCFHRLPPVVVGAAKDVGHEPWAATVEHIRSTFPGGALLAYVEELERALPARSKLKRPAALMDSWMTEDPGARKAKKAAAEE